jgi:hypothetical protein
MGSASSTISSVCVYCGSRHGDRQAYAEAARQVGEALAAAGIRLVYGGGSVGLMGVVADATLAAGGEAVGVIPRHLNAAEIAHAGLTEIVVVDSMHARKQRMFELSDAFVGLPGGIGTLDETVEILTWRQLRLHDKPLYLLDADGYWQPFLALLDHYVRHDFAAPAMLRLVEPVANVEALMAALARAPAPALPSRPERL